MIRRPPRSTLDRSSAASDVYKRQLPGRVEAAARDRAARRTTDNMDAYECVLTGKVLHHRSNRDDNAKAQQLLDRAIELDPNYGHAHAWKACVLGQTWVYN